MGYVGFSKSVEKYPTNRLLGSRQIIDGKVCNFYFLINLIVTELKFFTKILLIFVFSGGSI